MDVIENIIDEFVVRASRYLRDVKKRKVFPSKDAIDGLSMLDIPLQENPIDPAQVLSFLDNVGAPATTACSGNRYFGFVTGGSLLNVESVNPVTLHRSCLVVREVSKCGWRYTPLAKKVWLT